MARDETIIVIVPPGHAPIDIDMSAVISQPHYLQSTLSNEVHHAFGIPQPNTQQDQFTNLLNSENKGGTFSGHDVVTKESRAKTIESNSFSSYNQESSKEDGNVVKVWDKYLINAPSEINSPHFDGSSSINAIDFQDNQITNPFVEKAEPVIKRTIEFNQAINYVNKIKVIIIYFFS